MENMVNTENSTTAGVVLAATMASTVGMVGVRNSSSSVTSPLIKMYSAPSSPASSTTPPSPPTSPQPSTTPASIASPAAAAAASAMLLISQSSSENSTTPASGVASSGAGAAATSVTAAAATISSPHNHHQQQERHHQHHYAPYTLCSTPLKNSSNQTKVAYQLQQQNQQTPEPNCSLLLHTLREKLLTPGNSGFSSGFSGFSGFINNGSHNNNNNIALNELHAIRRGQTASSSPCTSKPLNVIKDRYLVSSHRYQMSAAAAAKTPASYRHLIDMTSSHLRCTDIFTEKQYLCKIINEPLYKVQRAYYQLLHDDTEGSESTIYGHSLIRGVHDIVPMNEQRTYVIIAPPPMPELIEETETETETDTTTTSWKSSSVTTAKTSSAAVSMEIENENNKNDAASTIDETSTTTTTSSKPFSSPPPPPSSTLLLNNGDYYYEDLHTYIRNKRRLGEAEARALFHQICQTVQVCHRNGVILRDLKLKRFYFIDEARTKLQYESLEGSMILDDPNDDTLRDKIGCPLYTAPELLCPNTTYRGKPADMWSLGVLLYTMLVGQYPFYEKGNCSLITVIRHCQVQIPSMLTRSVRWLLLALLRKNHEERMCAEQIFLTPWLREQRPYYMLIPANYFCSMTETTTPTTTTEEEEEEEIESDEDEDEEHVEEEAAAVEILLGNKFNNNNKRRRRRRQRQMQNDQYDDDDDDDDFDHSDDDELESDDDVDTMTTATNAEQAITTAMTVSAAAAANNTHTQSTHHRRDQNTRTSREFLAIAMANSSSISNNGSNSNRCSSEPLDYTCASLQFNCINNNNNTTQQQRIQSQQHHHDRENQQPTTSSDSLNVVVDVEMC